MYFRKAQSCRVGLLELVYDFRPKDQQQVSRRSIVGPAQSTPQWGWWAGGVGAWLERKEHSSPVLNEGLVSCALNQVTITLYAIILEVSVLTSIGSDWHCLG